MTAKEIAAALSEMESRYWSFTSQDRALLLQIADAEGLIVNKRCPDCYRDVFITLRNRHMKDKAKPKQKKWIFRGHRPLTWRGKQISGDSPIKDIEEFMAVSPFNRIFFALAKKEEKGEGDEA